VPEVMDCDVPICWQEEEEEAAAQIAATQEEIEAYILTCLVVTKEIGKRFCRNRI
jgi:hypothetical protein